MTGVLIAGQALAKSAARSTAAEPNEALVPVLRQDAKRGALVAAAGSLQGVRLGAEVSAGGRFVGVVDVVAPSMCRVRMLGSRALRLPVMALRREAASERSITCGVLVAEAGQLSFSAAARPDLLRQGDLVRMHDEAGNAGTLLGRIVVEGMRPSVECSAVDTSRGLQIGGVLRAADLSALYTAVPVMRITAPLGPDPRWLLKTAPAELHAGSAIVNAAGGCVGFVDEAGSAVHRARGMALVTAPIALRAVGERWESVCMLLPDAERPEGWRLELATAPPPDCESARLFSAAGTGFVPRGLHVGELRFRSGVACGVDFLPYGGALTVLEFGDRTALVRLLEAP